MSEPVFNIPFVTIEGFEEAWKGLLDCGFQKEDQAVALASWLSCARRYQDEISRTKHHRDRLDQALRYSIEHRHDFDLEQQLNQILSDI